MSPTKRAAGAAGLLLFTLLLLFSTIIWLSNTAVSLAEPKEETQPNIVFIVVDALRADHVSSYGYHRQTTPNVDAWVAEKGTLFTDVTAASSWTNPSNGALLTSHIPSSIDTVWSDMDRRIPAEEMMLAEYLQDAGYYTAGFVGNWWMQARFGYDQGFDAYGKTVGPNLTRASTLNDLATEWLDQNLEDINDDGQPLFLFLYYMDPHTWYDPPPPYDTKYDTTYTGTLTAEVYGHGHDVVAGEMVPSQRDIEHLIALYDGEISYWDFYLGEMFKQLEASGVLDNSIVIITSDHGQMFGEHGKWVHRNSLYEEVLRVPLLISYPGTVTAGQVFTTPVNMMDITPTLLDMVDLAVPSHMDGESLLPLMQGAAAPEDRSIISEMAGETDPNSDAYWIAPRTDLYSVKKEGWKLIHVQQARQQDELYAVRPSSVYEQENLVSQEVEKSAELFQELQEWFGVPDKFLFLPIVESN
jgi:arylsulfatase A-like enzyme